MSEKAHAEASPSSAEAKAHRNQGTRHLLLQRKCACGANSGLSGECESCASHSHTSLQRRAANGMSSGGIPASVERTLAEPGRPLDTHSRQFMESRFDRDFSHVRVHDDSAAARSAHDVDAHAYTVGSHIVFADGQYRPHTEGGQHLLAHELAHTIQQDGMQRSGTSTLVDQGPEYRRLEHEADAAASAALSRGPLPTLHRSDKPLLSRAATTSRDPQEVPSTAKVSSKPVNAQWPGGPTTHTVTPENSFQGAGAPTKEAREDSYIVDTLYVPGSKGPNALKHYQAMQGKALEATLNVVGRTKAVMWQERADTGDLQGRWLKSVGWPGGKAADALWKSAGGDDTFPKVGKETCQMDHIVELQVGGNNTEENIQALDAKQNRDSGGAIKSQVFGLAQAIALDPDLSAGGASQVRLRFAKAEGRGATETPPAACPPQPATCLAVEQCARKAGPVAEATAQPREDYPIYAGGPPTVLHIEATVAKAKKAATAPILADPLNKAAAELIPGLLLTTLHRHPGAHDTITAAIDTDRNTRLPISMAGEKEPVTLNVAKDGGLTLAHKDVHLAFTYRYLSPAQITKLALGEGNALEWQGRIQPQVSFLGPLDVSYAKGELKVSKGLERLKSPLPGFKLTRAELALILAPEFKPEGTLAFQAGPEQKPIAEGEIKVSRDDAGLVAKGDLEVHLPGVDQSHITVTYQNRIWSGDLTIQSTQIKIPYVESGSITLHVAENQGISAEGKLGLALPGGNKAEVSLRRQGDKWVFTGSGTFKIPKLDDTQVSVTYDGETLVATGKTGFQLYSLRGELEHVTYTAKKGEEGKITGTGSLEVNKGRVSGKIKVHLLPSGRFTGEGNVTVRITPNLTATAGIVINEKEQVRISGEIRIDQIELFKGVHGQKNLFDIEKNIPIPGVSIPGVGGIEAKIGGGVNIGYGIGPGMLHSVFISAAFNPLEDQPDLDVGMGGQLDIPAYARISGYIKGGIALDAFIAEVAGFLTVTVSLELNGGLNAKFDGHYAQHRFVVDAVAKISAALILGLGLDATVRAKAGIGSLSGELSKTWALKHLEVPTGLDFKLEAPIHYASDEPFHPPSLDTITFSPPPTIDPGDLLGRIFNAATSTETKQPGA